MLSVTSLNHFYYVRDFAGVRCKHSRVLWRTQASKIYGTQVEVSSGKAWLCGSETFREKEPAGKKENLAW